MGDSHFAQTLARHRSVMLERAKAIVRNPADAEDVVQEALERAWRSRGRFTPGAKAAPWLLKITQNAALSLLRRRPGTQFGETSVVATHNGPDDDVLRYESTASIARAVRDLAPSHRRAFLLHDLHGYSSREISMHLQLPYHTVRTHLHRARHQLRRALVGGES
ncbi:MAG TPA: RNA polymerase sigma factor [Candidatus Baltobacteraceae bacterium]|nr:RNA polymerase sigma factor [Candidatus Baltobacteraceae bacterium]